MDVIDEATARAPDEQNERDQQDERLLIVAEALLMVRRVTCEPGGHAQRWSEQHPFTKLEALVAQLKERT